MSDINKVSKNFIYSIISLIVTIIMGLLIPRLILVGYGSETNGLLSSVSQFIIYLSLFEAGIQNVARQALYKPVSVRDKNSINRILSAVNISYKRTAIIYFISLIIISFLYPLFIKVENLNFLTIFFVIFFSGLGNVLLFFFQGKYKILLEVEGKNYIITNTQTIISILNNVIKVILLYLNLNVGFVIFFSFLVSLIQVVYIMRLIKRNYTWIDLSIEPNYDALSQRYSMLIHQISGMIFQNTDVLILTIFCGLKIVSVYSMYKMIIQYISSILNAIYNSYDFKLGQLYNADKLKFIKMNDFIESYFSAIVFSLFSVTSCIILPFINLYTSGVDDINYIDKYLAILFVSVEILNFIRIPMLKVINYAGDFNNTLLQTIVETILNISISLIGVHKYGIYGVLFGTIVALMYRTVDIIFYSNYKLLNRKPYKTFIKNILNIIMFIGIFYIYNKINLKIETYFDFIIIGFVLTIGNFILFFTLQTLVFKENLTEIKKRILGGSKNEFI